MSKQQDTTFKSIVQLYFQTMSKKNTKSTFADRLASLRKMKTDLLNIYSPSYNKKHILLLSLLQEVIYIFETDLLPINTTVARENTSKKPVQLIKPVTSRTGLKQMVGNSIPLSKKSTAGFGATVYDKS